MRLLPTWPFTRTILIRSLVIWLVLRAVATVVTRRVPGSEPNASLDAPTAALLIGLVAWLTVRDSRRKNEVLFLGNLGVAPATLYAVAIAIPVLAEIAWWALR